MSDRLKGKVALITGGTSGIGAATAELFIKEGATVVITGRSVEKGQGLAESLGPNASYREADVMEEAAIADCIGYTTSTHGKLDILFNNAGGPVGVCRATVASAAVSCADNDAGGHWHHLHCCDSY